MSYILGAAVMIAAMAFLHAGRIVVQRIDATGSPREALALDAFAIGYTSMFAGGLIIMAQHLVADATPARLVAFLAALTGAVVGSKLVGAAFRRAAARPLAGPPPASGAPAA